MFRAIVVSLSLLVPFVPSAGFAQAATGESAAVRLQDALRLSDVLAIMREEGTQSGQELRQEMFPATSGRRWDATLARVYDDASMQHMLDAALADAALPDDAAQEALEFFSSELGQRVVRLELEARHRLLDDAQEDLARLAASDLQQSDPDRFALLQELVTANDLVEMNISGAMNSSLAFYRGMISGGAFPDGIAEGEILDDVWSQEPAIRADTETWVYPYLVTAYSDLSDADLRSYVQFSQSGAGQAMNQWLFESYDQVFARISEILGRETARHMAGQDI
ncbi:DUF2059 domain-containing protein [Falsirhodobacter sp. alg1]|uniref:DUF2059 domain-containing protein n=1 Tax=Falsirhodobacter sp. alg1 TaxID=1472418 RepID=UPI0005EEA2D4|nr:DUF2059 domain-containing protein [Falsirhodobacter sp. alg1]